jgi:hypothetical protein
LLEVRRSGQKEAVEKGPGVQRHRPLQIACVQCCFELVHVAHEPTSIQPDIGVHREEIVRLECTPGSVKRLSQRVPGPLGIRLRPEQPHDLVPAQPSLAGNRERSQQCQGPTLRRCPSERLAGICDHEYTAKRL